MNTNLSLRRILFGASRSLFLGLIFAYANSVAWANGPVGIPNSNFPASFGQPTNSAFHLAKGPVGRSGGAPPSTGGSSGGQDGGSSSGQGGGLGMDAPGGPKWTPPTKVERSPNPSDSGDLPGSPPTTGGGSR